MTDRTVTNDNLEDFFEEVVKALDEHKVLNASFQPVGTGKWGMARLWRGWMATTAKYMAGRGAKMPMYIKPDGSWYGERPFNADDAHELFTHQHMGADELGRRLSWAKSIKDENKDKERVATKGERFNALRLHEEWASNKGITLFKPRNNSEYQQLINKQEE